MTPARAVAIIALGALLAVPVPALPQTSNRTLRLAVLDDATETARARNWEVFRARLRELGYVEGRNLVIDARYARRENERLPALAAELVALKPDIVITAATPPAQAAMQATSTTPIVFTGVADPVAAGLVKSFARPGGNATGLSISTPELGTKLMELLLEIAPGAKRIACLNDTGSAGGVLVCKRMQEQARKLGVAIEMYGGQDPQLLERSLQAIARERFAGPIVGATSRLADHRAQIVQFAAQHRLPAIYAHREYAEAGGLLAYAPDFIGIYRRTADYVHRIAQGAKPSELPVERPDTFRMVLNLKTARTQGIIVPASVRHRADELID
jgi:putative tryptophan/tyrosine transport system substrate-binding protein